MLLGGFKARRPVIDIQAEPSDCGYLCLSALITTFGKRATLDRIKQLSGRTSRGLNIKQLRDAARRCGFSAQAVYFEKSRVEAIPNFGILLLTQGHYIAIAGRKGATFEVYDPQIGWMRMSHRRLMRKCTGMGIEIEQAVPGADGLFETDKTKSATFSMSQLLGDGATRKAMGLLVVAQGFALTLPLLSMWSVDRSFSDFSFNLAGMIAVGFLALTATSFLLSFVGELTFVRVKRFATVAMSKKIFAGISSRSAHWFDSSRSSTLNHRISSAFVYLDFRLGVVRIIITTMLSLLVGLAFIIFVSPWLAIPGLVTLVLSVIINLVFHNSERSAFSSQIDAIQRRQSFVFDVLGQLPLLNRHGSLASARTRYIANTRSVAVATSQLQVIRTWRDSIESMVRSMETLLFVVLAAVFMGMGEFTIGGFVALGAYKDLLAKSLGSLFQVLLQSRNYEVHRLQADAVLEVNPQHTAKAGQSTHGRLVANDISFGYSSFEDLVFDSVNFEIKPGQSVAFCGSSGCGKSTLLKVLAGQLEPASGEVTIDGQPANGGILGVSSVLQSDRIIGGTIRENLTLFRRDITDEQIHDVLALAQINDFVMDLPMRLDTNIHDGVGCLSGGQKQRLLLARALVTKPRLLFLDEATSSLQVEMEREILDSIRKLGCTLVVVTHRPEVWVQMDRVFFLKDRHLVECDPASRTGSASSSLSSS